MTTPDLTTPAAVAAQDQARKAAQEAIDAQGLVLIGWSLNATWGHLIESAAIALAESALPILIPIRVQGGFAVGLAVAASPLEEVEANDES